jgi:hypothetical protein
MAKEKPGGSRTQRDSLDRLTAARGPGERYSNVNVHTANGDGGWTREIERARLGY